MKLLAIVILGIASLGVWASLKSNDIMQNLKEENNRNRREKEYYLSLYRSANTKLIQFQDSLNKQCICK